MASVSILNRISLLSMNLFESHLCTEDDEGMEDVFGPVEYIPYTHVSRRRPKIQDKRRDEKRFPMGKRN